MSERDVALLSGLSLRAKVQRLAGCLSDLPERLRLLLEMRAGIGTGKPLALAAVSRRLHLSIREARKLQKRAVRMLIRNARSHGCGTGAGGATRFIAGLSATALAAVTQPWGAVGGVLAARYSKSPTPGGAGAGATQAGVGGANGLGLSRTADGGSTLLAVAIVLTGMVLIAILFAEELGLGPPFRRLRARWLRRPPR